MNVNLTYGQSSYSQTKFCVRTIELYVSYGEVVELNWASKNSTQTEAMMSWSNEIADIAAALSLSLGWVQDFRTPTPAKFISV